MTVQFRKIALVVVVIALLPSCAGVPGSSMLSLQPDSHYTDSFPSFAFPTPIPPDTIEYRPGDQNGPIILIQGGDKDVTISGIRQIRLTTGNGNILPSYDHNTVPDSYALFAIDDEFLFESEPTSRVEIAIDYLDKGTDLFRLQYDAMAGGPYGNGTFKEAGRVQKTDSNEIHTARFYLCDANFANRLQGGDIRLSDSGDGAETITRITLTRIDADGPQEIEVDSCGADPFDLQPDSDAIQQCINRTCDGDTVLFTSGMHSAGYQGYQIDKTIFLHYNAPLTDLTFTSTDPTNPALLAATADLKGFVVRLFARGKISEPGLIDKTEFSYINIDGNREERECYSSAQLDGSYSGNWGSWSPGECPLDKMNRDPWCSAGGLGFAGGSASWDPTQNYQAYPQYWSTGLYVHHVEISNTECGTALEMFAADSLIDSVVIDTAGDHVHAPNSACVDTDPDEELYDFSDGLTISGPDMQITNNRIINASDVGIAQFGGKNTYIAGNEIIVTGDADYGMFGGISLTPYHFGDLGGYTVVDNRIVSERAIRSTPCGGIHAGINIGAHMWGAGCNREPVFDSVYGIHSEAYCSLTEPYSTPSCSGESDGWCRVWGYVPTHTTFTVAKNTVTGAHISYLIQGLSVDGALVTYDNQSITPHWSDWEGAHGCYTLGSTVHWMPLDFVAHDPGIPGWVDRPIYCER